MIDERTKKRFWSKVDKRGPNDCWEWQGGIDGKGYGAFWDIKNKRQIIASRMAYIITNGSIPNGKMICHKCDNPRCVNPIHLYAGTAHDNMVDKVRRGRANTPRGEKHGASKLTRTQVLEIIELRKKGEKLDKIAERFSISFQHVSDICHRRKWGWLQKGE